ncbi:MAG: sigma-54 dependent transcriptional regulator [Lentisphaeria bacterium]|jgi:DNA-binding NtrC family response regulator
MLSLLIIDDEEAIRYAFCRHFAARGHRVAAAATLAAGLAALQRQPPDLLFLDLCLPDGNGLDLLARLRTERPALPVVAITAYGSLDTVVKALEGKAFDYLPKPFDLALADALVRKAEAALAAAAEPGPEAGAVRDRCGFVGRSPAIQEVFKQLVRAAATDASLLLLGETGTGKELAARTLHQLSPRRAGPFVAVNCGALPETLVESELFGHAKGAFTGATADRPGRFEQASGGTLFLDEIADLPLPAQVKLLRVLDTRQVEPLGGTAARDVDLRIVAATNRDLQRDVAAGCFRADLYYRLCVVQIRLPPLRERRDDLPLLASHFLDRFTAGRCTLAPATLDRLRAAEWPGNVRELRNALEHACLAAGGAGPLLPDHLPPSLRGAAGGTAAAAPPAAGPELLRQWLEALAAAADAPGRLYARALGLLEQELFRLALERTGGNRSAAADLLGLHRNTLARKLDAG